MIPGLHLDTSVDGLVPAAFDFAHTAAHAALVDPDLHGGSDFARWVSLGLTRLLALPFAEGGYLDLAVVVEDSSGLRLRWDDAPCSQPGWLAARVRDEVAALEDPWMLAIDARDAPRGCVAWDDHEGDYLPCEVARSHEPHRHATWYAEARGRGVAKVMGGGALVEPAGDGTEIRLAMREEPTATLGAASLYRRVLRGHPARRRHRLR